MAIRSDEIVNIIKSAIDTFDTDAETRNVGTVVEVGDGIAQVYGLAGDAPAELPREDALRSFSPVGDESS